ncbi:MAG TPA: NADH-quinone oxidoreductase subunit NuoH [Saprospiraceae bacterium]|nr:NADH-quinone oxidoreductase subunit NuoH [Saprospiraceae bacterium]HQW55343.1 NADH-quinone oxidoreductase subunit NuoH [Saprospiraceae bacterium]
MDWSLILEKSILAVVVFSITLVIAMYSTYGERKIAAFFQDRLGPNRAGPWGIFQPLADGGKLFFKEEIIPDASVRWLFILGPGIAMFLALSTSAVIPWAPDYISGDRTVAMQVADPDMGILYIFGILSLGVYGLMLGGWASNNKYSLYGAIRASSQIISYELAMGLSVIAVIIMTGSLSLRTIVESQHGMNWNIFYQPLGFILFMTTALAECNRAPFDMAECETELIGGYHTEFSSMKLGLYLFSEYINMFISSAVITVLFFGGYNFPGMDMIKDPMWLTVLGAIVFFAKIFFFIFLFMWIRWTLPRFRYDQLMRLGWKGLIPLAIVNLLLTAGFMMWKHF